MPNILENLSSKLDYPLFELDGTTFSLEGILKIIILLLIVDLIVRKIKLFLKRILISRFGVDEGTQEAITTLISYLIGLIATIISLQISGINLGSLTVIVGSLGLGIGLGLQDLTKDFISGLLLLLERSIKVNDFLEFGEVKGTVKKVSLLATFIQTIDGGNFIIPNSQIINNKVLNWSYGESKNCIRIPLKLKTDVNLLVLTDIILTTAYLDQDILAEPIPKLLFKEISLEYLDFEVQVWTKAKVQEEQIKSRLNYQIMLNLRKQRIEFNSDFDLWLKNPQIQLLKPFNHFNESELTGSNSNDLSSPSLLILDLLKQVSYFQKFNDIEMYKLLDIGYRKRLDQSQILFNEGDPGDSFYIILTGLVEVFIPKLEKQLNVLRTGDFFGELSLILGINRTASVRALEPTVLFAINQQGFKKMLQEHKELSEIIIQELEKHKDEIANRQQQLREMGLLSQEEVDPNLVAWARKRLSSIFS